MWILILFDLPTETKTARKQYTQFRNFLLKDGFARMQYSVYYRHSPSKENADVHVNRIKKKLPPDGEVRILRITDKQFERMLVFWGKKRTKTEIAPVQLEFF